MTPRVVWVKVRANKSAPDAPIHQRVWWPVWWPPHSDPQLGKAGRKLHVHVAVDRLPDSTVRRTGLSRQALHRWPIPVALIQTFNWGRSTPILAPLEGPPRMPHVELKLMGREGPFNPAPNGACPHQGCPLDHAVEDSPGVVRCPWHGVRVRVTERQSVLSFNKRLVDFGTD